MRLFRLILFSASVFICQGLSAAPKQLCIYRTAQGSVKQVNSLDEVPEEVRSSATCFAEKAPQSSEKPQNGSSGQRGWSLKNEAVRSSAAASDGEHCVYQNSAGQLKKVHSIRMVPSYARATAKCSSDSQESQNNLSRPDEIDLEGTVRRVDMASSMGRVDLRWPRKVEVLFGRTPERAMADAARTVSRTLKQSGFSTELRTARIDWNVVFLDQNLPAEQIPDYLRQNCHPGWMVPPANVYIVAQRVAGGCAGGEYTNSRVTDSRLSEVLLHEMGHAVEYRLLGPLFGTDRMRAEGFATWFQQYASDYSSVISRGELRKRYFDLARRAFADSPAGFQFSGSGEDYARASLYFHVIVNRRGVKGLMDIYSRMVGQRTDFLSVVKDYFNWSDKKLNEEVLRLLN